VSKEKLLKAFRKPGELLLKTTLNDYSLAPWKLNIKQLDVTQDFCTVL